MKHIRKIAYYLRHACARSSVCLSVPVVQLGCQRTDFHEIKFDL